MHEIATAQVAMLGWTEIILILATLSVLALFIVAVLVAAAVAIRHWSRTKTPPHAASPPASKI